MKGERRVCPACWRDNKAIVFGCKESPSKCWACTAELKPASSLFGDNWRAVLEHELKDVGSIERGA
jgi:hypothetical protein